MLNILWRTLKWRLQNPVSILITIVQPLIWLVLYSSIAGQSMPGLSDENYTAFILPGLMVLVTFSSCCSGGILNYIMKSSNSFYRILIAPVRRSSIVLGQMLEAVLLSFFEVFVLMLVGIFLGVRVASGPAGWVLMLLLLFLTAFFMAGLAYVISLCLPNEVVYETVMNTIVLPVFFMSTALFPLDQLSGTVRCLVILNPFTHIINNLRMLIFGEKIIFVQTAQVVLLFAGLGAAGFALALWRLKREMVC